jgi:nucleoside-diphosphate-sugar epimerase
MKVILFGATGMVGQGVLRECLRDDVVEAVLAVGRSSTGRTHPKLRELIRKDLFDFGAAGSDLARVRRLLFLPWRIFGGHEREGLHAPDL